MTLAIIAIALYFVVLLTLAEVDHRRHRVKLGLRQAPSPFAQFIDGRAAARHRTEARLGISPRVGRHR